MISYFAYVYLPNIDENWRVPLKHSSRYIHASFVNVSSVHAQFITVINFLVVGPGLS